MHHGCPCRNIEIGGINVGSGGSKITVERQGLVEFSGDMQPDILGNAAVVGIEIAVVPLVAALVLSRTVGPRIVAANGHRVLSFYYIRCKVEAAGHHAVLAIAQVMTVDIEIGSLTYTLELHEDLSLQHIACGNELLPVPADGVGQVDDILAESLVAVEGIGQRHPQPLTVVVAGVGGIGEIAHAEAPLAVEIELLSLDGLSRQANHCQQHHKQHDFRLFHCRFLLFLSNSAAKVRIFR